MNSSYYNYQTMPNQTKLARNLVWNNRFYLQELLLLLFFYLGPIWIFFCTKFRKKNSFGQFWVPKTKKYEIFRTSSESRRFFGLFLFSEEKNLRWPVLRYLPLKFQVLESIIFFLLTWHFWDLRDQKPFVFPLQMSPFQWKLDKNWLNGRENKICVFSKFVAVTL